MISDHFDIGADGSKRTRQIATGLDYQCRQGTISLTYRYLAFTQLSSSQVVVDINLGGPMLVAAFSL